MPLHSRQRLSMSLRQFVSEFVHEDSPEHFVVRKDLLDSYTQWRQKRFPNSVMQLADLEKAGLDVNKLMPSEAYHQLLTVTKDGAKGLVHDCWQKRRLSWPGGNKTQPIQQTSGPNHAKVADTIWTFHYRFKYSPQPLTDFLSAKVTSGPENVSSMHDKLKRACTELSDKGEPWCCASKQIGHEGSRYSVILLCSGSSREKEGLRAYEPESS